MRRYKHCFWPIVTTLIWAIATCSTESQIVPDTTLPKNSIVTPNGNTLNITGGTEAGANLFHSFSQFSVPTDNTAYFNNSSAIANIISRVTGNSISNIDGLIKANGSANLFLINPRGIIFGQNARLEIGGSFLASTASSIQFPNALEFSAANPAAKPLLSVNVPLGLQFGDNPGTLIDRSLAKNNSGETVGLSVERGRTIGLVGGNLSLEGGIVGVERGRIELGSVETGSFVPLIFNGSGYALDYAAVQNFRDIKLSQGAIAFTTNGGDIQVQGRKIAVAEGAGIFTIASGGATGGNLFARAADAVEVTGENSFLSTATTSGSTGNAGDITIATGSLLVSNGARVSSNVSTSGTGNAGKITVQAADKVEVLGVSQDGSQASTLGTLGAGGRVDIVTRILSILDGGKVQSQNNGIVGTPVIAIEASDRIDVAGQDPVGFVNEAGEIQKRSSQISTSTLSNTNAAGAIQLVTKLLSIRDSGSVNATTFTDARGGDINVRASERVEILDRVGIASSEISSESGEASGRGGNITVTTPELLLDRGGALSTRSLSRGIAGNIVVDVDRLNVLGGSNISAQANNGNAGDIRILARSSVNIVGDRPSANDPGILFGSAIASSTDTNSTGKGGNIFIQTPFLSVRDGGNISTDTLGTGNAGNIEILADAIEVLGVGSPVIFEGRNFRFASQISSDSVGSGEFRGNGGNISIEAKQVSVRGGGAISADTGSTANAGNLTIRATDFIEVDGFVA